MNKLEFRKGECYATNRWYNVTVTINPDTDDEIEITCSVGCSDSDNRLDEWIEEVTVINPEDLPEGVTQEDIVELVKEKWDE